MDESKNDDLFPEETNNQPVEEPETENTDELSLPQEDTANLASLIDSMSRLSRMVTPALDMANLTANILGKNDQFAELGNIAVTIPEYYFCAPAVKALEQWTNSITNGLLAFASNSIVQNLNSITADLCNWSWNIDISPLVEVLLRTRADDYEHDCEELAEAFLQALFDAKWFPYAGWLADVELAEDVFQILDTSRASKNRIKRIDKIVFAYYCKTRIDDIKRGWRKKNLPSYMIRILIQSVQAYYRREYALTVCTLSTLWEGIIQEKVNDNSYRICKKTRDNLTKLIEQNQFDGILSSFCEQYILYDCRGVDEVIPDVPGRHGIAHCWYNTYPNRKTALNAILFTDFLLGLEPVDHEEDVVPTGDG